MSTRRAPEIDAVLFDKDGTLFDFAATWEVWAAGFLIRLSEGDRVRAATLGRLIGYDFDTNRFQPDSVAIAGTPDDMAGLLGPEFPNMPRAHLFKLINDEAASTPQAPTVPLGPFLSGLKRSGLKLGVATNDAEEPAIAHLEAAEIRGFFDFVAGSDSGHGAKPEPGQLFAFCDLVGVQPDRTLVVGDSTHDLVAGRAAGMWTAAVLTGIAGADELARYADIVIPDIGHLPNWLDVGCLNRT
jgi:phosphoglycolate phosphatase